MNKTITLGASCKVCRREGEKLFLKGDRCNTPKCAIVKRKYVPGVHGLKRNPRLSEYGLQLRAKQKAKRLFGVQERQFVNYYKNAMRGGDGEINLMQQLEMRLDNVVARLGLAISRGAARQMVGHGHVLVNGKKLDVPSYQVKPGDIISISKDDFNKPLFKGMFDRLAQWQVPSWLSLEKDIASGKVLNKPTLEDFEPGVQIKQIIEFYSRF